jgi:hypothetical protein
MTYAYPPRTFVFSNFLMKTGYAMRKTTALSSWQRISWLNFEG